jgi:hypothetical protein
MRFFSHVHLPAWLWLYLLAWCEGRPSFWGGCVHFRSWFSRSSIALSILLFDGCSARMLVMVVYDLCCLDLVRQRDDVRASGDCHDQAGPLEQGVVDLCIFCQTGRHRR